MFDPNRNTPACWNTQEHSALGQFRTSPRLPLVPPPRMMVAQDGPPRTDTQHLRACTAVSQGLSPWKSEDFRHPIHAAPGHLMETQFEAEWNIWGQFSKLKIYLETCEYFLLPSPSFPELFWLYAKLHFTWLWGFFPLQFGHIYFLSWFRKWNRGAEQDRRDLTFLSRMWPQHPLTPGLSVHSGLCKGTLFFPKKTLEMLLWSSEEKAALYIYHFSV